MKKNNQLNYKESLYFIAKCLTISFEEKDKDEIELILKTTDVDWDTVVKVSTAHYVFPALYCNLKHASFLNYLPKDLVAYMKHLTDINRERNLKIIDQAKELNNLLVANNITPIFLKGTANLLATIYEDVAERMVGDIDFIFSKKDYPNAISILRDFGYAEVNKYDYYFPNDKHFRRLQKRGNIAAIEIHSEILSANKYRKEFNYNFVTKDCQLIEGISVLSYANKLNLSIIANQINDNGFHYKTMALRNAYDVFVLSKKTNAKIAMQHLDKLKHPLNCYLAACYELFNNPSSLSYNNNNKTAAYLCSFQKQFSKPKTTKRKHKRIQVFLFIKHKLKIIYKSIIYKEYRIWLYRRLSDKNWYKEKMIQLGFTNKTTK